MLEVLVKGNIEASSADIEGETSGKLKVLKTLNCKSNANISGDVVVGKLSIEPGATFNASCVMKGYKKMKIIMENSEQKEKPKKTFK